jgi:hypothetical protein
VKRVKILNTGIKRFESNYVFKCFIINNLLKNGGVLGRAKLTLVKGRLSFNRVKIIRLIKSNVKKLLILTTFCYNIKNKAVSAGKDRGFYIRGRTALMKIF